MSEWTLLAVPAGFLLDLLAGDPHWLYHPVRLVGKLIEILEKALRRCFPKTEKGEKAAGLFAVLEACGLLQPVPGQPNGKARRYYMNLPRPKEPNEL